MKQNQQPILLVRISKKEYSKTLLEDHKVYMNPQIGFHEKNKLTSGQCDPNEGLVTSMPLMVKYSTDHQYWTTLTNARDIISIRKDSNAYIFCMYAVQFDPVNYNPVSKKYTQIIPWDYIKDFINDGEINDYEMLIFLDSVAFKDILCEASTKAGLSYCAQLIFYDLEEKQTDPTYLDEAKNNTFTSVFHKEGKKYGIQNEYRFAAICPKKPDHIELPIENLERAKIKRMNLFERQDIQLTFNKVELQSNGHFKSFAGMNINFINV